MQLKVELVAIDCPDPHALAKFYGELLNVPIGKSHNDWVEINTGDIKVAFQLAPDLQAPKWPDPNRPQQMHLDIEIESHAMLDEAEQRALKLGARTLPGGATEENSGFKVYADPAGHPFCLVWYD